MNTVTAPPALTVHRLGDRLVNFYLVEAGSDLVLVDAGLPAHWDGLRAAVHGLGRQLTDIAAVLVTHGHPDHTGLVERVRAASGAQVWVHESDAPILAAPRRLNRLWKPERSLLRYAVRRPSGLRAPLHLARNGALSVPAVQELNTFRTDRQLDVPGAPLAVHTPGHTGGSTTFLFPQASVAFTGDALVTDDSVGGRTGPCLICRAFTQDSRAALDSLDRMAEHDIRTVLPGHGDPWTDGLAAAARHATACLLYTAARGLRLAVSLPSRRLHGRAGGLRPPVTAPVTRAGQQTALDQVPAQRRVVVVDGEQRLVDLPLGVLPVEVEQEPGEVTQELLTAGRSSGDRGQPSVREEGGQFGRVVVHAPNTSARPGTGQRIFPAGPAATDVDWFGVRTR